MEEKKLSKRSKGLIGEKRVEFELASREICCTLAPHNQKDFDLFAAKGTKAYQVQVKSKFEGDEWRGPKIAIEGDRILILVNYTGKKHLIDRPDVYILGPSEWELLLSRRTQHARDMIPTRGIGIRQKEVEEFKENWVVFKNK